MSRNFDDESPGVNADELDAFVLGKLQTALEGGALADALKRAGLDRDEVLAAIGEETIDGETICQLITCVNVGDLHNPTHDPENYDYEQKIEIVWPALRNEPRPCGSGEKFKRCHGAG